MLERAIVLASMFGLVEFAGDAASAQDSRFNPVSTAPSKQTPAVGQAPNPVPAAPSKQMPPVPTKQTPAVGQAPNPVPAAPSKQTPTTVPTKQTPPLPKAT
jgi:hypothetical protein